MIEHVETVLAIELLAACQGMGRRCAIDRRRPQNCARAWPADAQADGSIPTHCTEFHRPHRTTAPLEALHALVRKDVAPWDVDRQVRARGACP